jgi:hypothetical protein
MALDFFFNPLYNLSMDNQVKRKRGRPPLSPEEREARRIEHIKRSNEYHKKTGYAAQAKYKKNHYDELTVLFPKKARHILEEIITKEGKSISSLFLNAFEEKYNIKLSNK